MLLDEEFRPVDDESDDEETIDVEEKAAEQEEESHAKELELLQKESEEPIEEILSKLPQEALEGDGNSTEDSKGEAAEGTDLKAVVSVIYTHRGLYLRSGLVKVRFGDHMLVFMGYEGGYEKTCNIFTLVYNTYGVAYSTQN